MEVSYGVTWREKRQARQQNLYEYLINNHSDKIEFDGNSLRLLSNKSISIKKGYAGYKDFANDETGNGIDFLVKHLGFSFIDAVNALNNETESCAVSVGPKTKKYTIPERADNNERVTNYLAAERQIDRAFIKWLIDKNVLYQDKYRNCVFINKAQDFYEQRGTYGSSYHRNGDKSNNNTNYWYFNNPRAKFYAKAFICESAIDAISLCLLRPDDAYYFSIAGVGNQQRIDMIKEHAYDMRLQVYTAFDNDEAGQQGRDRNKDLKHIMPDAAFKDWNEQLVKGQFY